MASKDIRNGIITLIILAIGIKLVFFILGHYVDIAQAQEIGKSFEDMGNLIVYGCAGIILLLIPFYLSARSNEKQKKKEFGENYGRGK